MSKPEVNDKLNMKVTSLKRDLKEKFGANVNVITPPMMPFDLSRYQKHLDKLHQECHGHEVLLDQSEKISLIANAMYAVTVTREFNELIRKDALSSLNNMSPWNVFIWTMPDVVNKKILKDIPVDEGHIPNQMIVADSTAKIAKLIREYQDNGEITRVYFVGDPRLNALKNYWPANRNVEAFFIPDGKLCAKTVIQRLKQEPFQVGNTLFVICFSMKNYVIIKVVDTCEGHESCKYVTYQSSSNYTQQRSTIALLQGINDEMITHCFKGQVALSPILPVDFSTYRESVAKRHMMATGHNVLQEFPDQEMSNLETFKMIKDVRYMSKVIDAECSKFNIGCINLPECITCEKDSNGIGKLVNGLSLTENMMLEMIRATFKYIDKLTGSDHLTHLPQVKKEVVLQKTVDKKPEQSKTSERSSEKYDKSRKGEHYNEHETKYKHDSRQQSRQNTSKYDYPSRADYRHNPTSTPSEVFRSNTNDNLSRNTDIVNRRKRSPIGYPQESYVERSFNQCNMSKWSQSPGRQTRSSPGKRKPLTPPTERNTGQNVQPKSKVYTCENYKPPRRISRSPNRRARSPKRRSRSPRRQSRSPRRRSRSPVKRYHSKSRSPDKYSNKRVSPDGHNKRRASPPPRQSKRQEKDRKRRRKKSSSSSSSSSHSPVNRKRNSKRSSSNVRYVSVIMSHSLLWRHIVF